MCVWSTFHICKEALEEDWKILVKYGVRSYLLVTFLKEKCASGGEKFSEFNQNAEANDLSHSE